MGVTIRIGSSLRASTEGQRTVEVDANTLGEAMERLIRRYPDLEAHLAAETGPPERPVRVFLGDERIALPWSNATPLSDNDVITIARMPEVDLTLSREEILRYSRHLIIPGVGMEGQRRLKASSVLLVGAGGLGSPVALYLAAAGVGRIGLADFDVVETSNLQRQVLYGVSDLERPKLEAARERLHDVNPHVAVEAHDTRLVSENALEILGEYDVVVDGTDNFPTRYLVNDACALLGRPNVYGSIYRFEGQNSVFWAERGPCYRCLFPQPPPPRLVPSCAEGGVLGVLPGIVGAIQATEAIKLILGKGELLVGRLLLFDALELKFRELKLRKDPGCPLCGERATIRELVDYEVFCGVGATRKAPEPGAEIPPADLKTLFDRNDSPVIVDVRSREEWEICRLERARLIPMRELPARMHELDSCDEIVFVCKVGDRSAEAVDLLRRAGFRRVRSLRGGLMGWAEKIDPTMPRY